MNPLLQEVKKLLQGAEFSWAVCGGFALELFLDEEIRTHGDIDICVFESNRGMILRHMLERDWIVYEFRGMGKVRPIRDAQASEPGRNLLCLKEGCELIRFYPCDEQDQYHQFLHTGIRELNYVEFLFNQVENGEFLFDPGKGIRKRLAEVVRFRNGIPYLTPEITLLYKASRWEEEQNRQDFERVYHRMDPLQQNWLMCSLETLYPQGHPWIR